MVDPHRLLSDASLPPLQQQLHVDAALSQSLPATPDGILDVGTPGPETVAPRGLAVLPVNDVASLLDFSLPRPLPLPSTLPQPPLSPKIYDPAQLDLTTGLPPTPLAPPSPSLFKTPQKLQLPSFDVLGIAAPHPDRYPLHPTHSFSSLGAGPLSKPDDPLHALSPPLARSLPHDASPILAPASPSATSSQLDHLLSTFTPPSELGTINWPSFVNPSTAALGSPPHSDPGVLPGLATTASATAPGQAPIIVPTLVRPREGTDMVAWVDQVKNTISKRHGAPRSVAWLSRLSYRVWMLGFASSQNPLTCTAVSINYRPCLWTSHCHDSSTHLGAHIVDQRLPCPSWSLHVIRAAQVSAVDPWASCRRRFLLHQQSL